MRPAVNRTDLIWIKRASIRVDDYLYNGFQYGYNPTGMLASNQQAPNYDVNLVFIAYRYSFQ